MGQGGRTAGEARRDTARTLTAIIREHTSGVLREWPIPLEAGPMTNLVIESILLKHPLWIIWAGKA